MHKSELYSEKLTYTNHFQLLPNQKKNSANRWLKHLFYNILYKTMEHIPLDHLEA